MRKRTSSEVSLRAVKGRTHHRPASRAQGLAAAPLAWSASAFHATWIGLLLADAASFAAFAAVTLVGAVAPAAVWLGAAGWLALRAIVGLYDPISHAPPEDLRRSCLTTVVACIGHLATLFLLGQLASLWLTTVAFWAGLLLLPWLARQLVRQLLVLARLHGAPVVVVGAGVTAEALIDELRTNPEQGLYPVAVFADDRSLRGQLVAGVPVVGDLNDAIDFAFAYPVDHALIALSADESAQLHELSSQLAGRFGHVHLTPEFVGLANLWVRARAIGPLVTFEFRQDGVTPLALVGKRWFDAALGLLFLLLATPVIALCALMVKLLSPGPAFFSHVREGHRGRLIRVWKIRTMVPDAEDMLHEHLRENTSARREWAERVKLDADPRVIPRLGTFLRRWSLDELPQLWNVVNGSMSLVGPRPFPEYHLSLFPNGFRELRRHLPPGVTGLWQVTYRTDGDLTHQQAADTYYVHNRSIWLDLWILLRTVRVVFAGSGI